jgi:hypothetical protein
MGVELKFTSEERCERWALVGTGAGTHQGVARTSAAAGTSTARATATVTELHA